MYIYIIYTSSSTILCTCTLDTVFCGGVTPLEYTVLDTISRSSNRNTV